MKLKIEYLFYSLPFVIAFSRIIHLLYTGYIIPDESNYASMSIIFHETGQVLIDQGREIYQYILLYFSIVFGLDDIYKMIFFMSFLTSLFASSTLYLCNKILKKLYPDFKDRWFILLSFFLSPMYVVLIGIGITEIFSIFLIMASIYVYYCEKNPLCFGLLLGLGYSIREPLALIVLFFSMEFIYNREWLSLTKYFVGLIPFLYFPYNILAKFSLRSSLALSLIRYSIFKTNVVTSNMTQSQGNFRYTSPAIFKQFPSLSNFFINNAFCIMITIVFSIGLISCFLMIHSFKNRGWNKWQIISIGLMLITSIYISRFDAYSYDRLSRVGTIARLSILSIFGIMFSPTVLKLKSSKDIQKIALVSILVTLALFVPFTFLAQRNLSKYGVNRLSLDYKAPWLITKNILTSYQDGNSLVLCEPMSKIRFFKVEGINYIPLPHNETDAFNLIKNYDCVFIYLEIHRYFGLIDDYAWLYQYLENADYSFEFENDEFVLIRMV